MLRAFTNLFSGPAFEALRIREENAALFIDGLISEKEKLHMQIKLMGIRIREQRKQLRLSASRQEELQQQIDSGIEEIRTLNAECFDLETQVADLTRRLAKKKKPAKKAK